MHRIASNYRWTWSTSARALLDGLPGASSDAHPVVTVSRLDEDQLLALAQDADLVARLVEESEAIGEAVTPVIAYCSPEFGLSDKLAQYAGGLGVLAGDHLKTASDLGIPLLGLGLFYRGGVFHQVIEHGYQHERYDSIEPEDVGAQDTGVLVEILFPGRNVAARVWRIDVGRVPLYLLDTDLSTNSEHDRAITDRLYSGSRDHRLEQEIVLGVGGAKALSELGHPIQVHHLNEGHAGFIVLELIDRHIEELGLETAWERVRAGVVFTTHTPVPAGIDKFHVDTIGPYIQLWAHRWGLPFERVWELGADPEDASHFNMAALCLRSARTANGVSEVHGQVSRKLFAGVGIGDDISHVTNGVHSRTWTAGHAQTLFDEVMGPGWAEGESAAWARVVELPDDRLRQMRARSSRSLSDLVRISTGDVLDPDALIIGFARRFAPYKRATLLMHRRDLLGELLGDEERPVHLVFAGKAHPSDSLGKELVSDIVQASGHGETRGRLTFLPDYDMGVALAMVQGCDIWLNNPIRPREASGTSGEKAALNGALNCSILDGWWAEMYDGTNGWAIEASQTGEHDPLTRDNEEAENALRTLLAIRDEYHAASSEFRERILHAWRTLGPRITAARMVREYEENMYAPILETVPHLG